MFNTIPFFIQGSIISAPPAVLPSGYRLYVDAGLPASYSGSGTAWNDLSGNNYNLTLSSTTTFETEGAIDYLNFDNGVAKYLPGGTLTNIPGATNGTLVVYGKMKSNDAGNWRTLTRAAGAGGMHQVIVQTGTDNYGMYSGSISPHGNAFLNSSYVGTVIESDFTLLAWKFSSSASPYWDMRVTNLNTSVATLTIADARIDQGFGSFGAWHGDSSNPNVFDQTWGKIALIVYYPFHLTTEQFTEIENFISERFA